MVHPASGPNVQELIAYAKSNPGKVHFGSAGIGTTPHLSGELFKSMAKVEIVHVPYRRTGPAMNDLIGGHIQMFFDLLPASLPQINGGKVRALANAGAKRPAALPDLPTVAEQGLPGFDLVLGGVGGAVEDATRSSPSCARRSVAVSRKDIVARIRELGSEPGMHNESDVRAFLDASQEKWRGIRVSGEGGLTAGHEVTARGCRRRR